MTKPVKQGFFISVLSHYRPENTDGQVGLMVEYMAVGGARQSGKFELIIAAQTSSFRIKFLHTKIKEKLATILGVTPAEIVLMGS
jgi:hypothetical protein